MPAVIVLFFFWSIGRYIDLSCLYVSTDSAWYTYFTFSLVHVNFWHLLINSIVFVSYWNQARVLLGRKDIIPLLSVCMFVPPVAAFLSVQDVPTCGFSAVMCSFLGYMLTKTTDRIYSRAMWTIAISFAMTFFFADNINTTIHIYSLTLPLLIRYYRKEL